ncbi:MAG: putative N-acetylgalactosaminyl-diphosphoundecaprenol glucuronosyltransferase [Candidatus Nomurabacteria bacterium]|nr:putative N-acetylgalactosaminyl-diphosphoundecaprenol glucuronosyltransferase [Candidatus Nomurabacteria bacterium]
MSLISVIIPAYNREKYLEAAVRSVLDQTITDIEVLVIDDASTDTTGSIADRLSQEDSRIRVLHHEQNKLRSGALNTGLDNAKGEYISFLDSDDYYLADKLERQINFLESHPQSDGVYGDFEILLEDRTDTKGMNAISSVETVRERLIAKTRGETSDVMSGGYIPSCSVLIRASVFSTIRFDPILRNMEDFDMWLQILGKGFVLTKLPGSTYVYRRHGEQKSSDSERMIIARAIIEEKMKGGIYLQNQ